MTIEQLFERRSEPKKAAIAMYEAMYDHFATSAQLYAGSSLQQTVGEVAVMYLIAADAERNDPEPRDAPTLVCCPDCMGYRMTGAKGPHALS